MVELSSYLAQDRVVDLEAKSKDAVLAELVGVMKSSCDDNVNWDDFELKLREREAQSTTAMGMGVAIPHTRLPGLSKLRIAVGRSRQGIEYGAPDGAPAHLIFLVAVGNDHGEYMKTVARLAWLVRNDGLRTDLLKAADAAALFQTLSNY